jgi:hypothetical protein
MTGYASIMMITSWCASCRAETPFEHPECGDEHGRDCPEWACTVCGEAIMVGFELADPRAARGPGRVRRRRVGSSGAA